ncbi:MAG: hypothetical protein R3C99_18010 [Pirellulaceae bacterium]
MSKAVEARRSKYSPEVIAKMQELARLIGAEKYGERPPLKTTWAEIEAAGHEVGRLMATEFDQVMQRQHAEHYDHAKPCPQCGKDAGPAVKHRDLCTRDGTADLSEPEFRCVSCERSFFPSADGTGH